MSVYLLGPDPFFPDPAHSEPDGLLAVGGDLTLERLVAAYGSGVFPWYGPDTPILWWSPDPRPVLFPGQLTITQRLKRYLKKRPFSVTVDTAFERVIAACAKTPRPQGPGTWLTAEMTEAYLDLHESGLAHSVEVWQDGQLAGGLYGVAIGKAFYGESMFHRQDHASKLALIALAQLLDFWEFRFIDCQQTTPHVVALGAREIPRCEFLVMNRGAVFQRFRRGLWQWPKELDPYPA